MGKQNYKLLYNEDGTLTERGKTIINHTPFKRFGKVEELTGAVLFLVNERVSGFITGISLPVDGGYLVDNI